MDLDYRWHLDAMCKHLESVAAGKAPRLLINLPPSYGRPHRRSKRVYEMKDDEKPMAAWLALHIKKRVQKYPSPVTLDFPVAKPGHGKSVADDVRPLLPSDWTVTAVDGVEYNAFERNLEIVRVEVP
jgi:hypothetical protein